MTFQFGPSASMSLPFQIRTVGEVKKLPGGEKLLRGMCFDNAKRNVHLPSNDHRINGNFISVYAIFSMEMKLEEVSEMVGQLQQVWQTWLLHNRVLEKKDRTEQLTFVKLGYAHLKQAFDYRAYKGYGWKRCGQKWSARDVSHIYPHTVGKPSYAVQRRAMPVFPIGFTSK